MQHHVFAAAAASLDGRAVCLRPDALPSLVAQVSMALSLGEDDAGPLSRLVGNVLGRSGPPRAARALALSSAVEGGVATPYGYRVDGVAVVRIAGCLWQEAWVFEWDGKSYVIADGYDRILSSVAEAVADGNAAAVLLDVSSPGGVVAGCFEAMDALAAMTQRAGGPKPIIAHVNDQACSAAYGLISQADRIVAAGSSLSANIGAYRMHYSFAEMLARTGVKPTIIKSHDLKGGFHSDFPLDDAAQALVQAEVSHASSMLVDRVAAARGQSADAVNAHQAAWFIAPTALAHGLIDEIAGFATTLSALSAGFSPAATAAPASQQETEMKRSAVLAAMKAANLSAQQQAAVEAELPAEDETEDLSAAEGDTPADAETDPAAAEGDPVDPDTDAGGEEDETPVDAKTAKAILTLPEAKGREAQAQQLAFTAGMTVASAKAILAAGPRAGALGAAMSGRDPKLTAAPSASGPQSDYEAGRALGAQFSTLKGRKPRAA